MNFSYFNYLAIMFLENACCCLVKHKEKNIDDPKNEKWFIKSKRSIEKFEIAKKKLDSEVDIKNIIQTRRITSFLNKINMTRRQRLSVDYFRRYTVTD